MIDNKNNEWLPCLIILCLLSILGACINGFILCIFVQIKSVHKNANKFLITLIIGQILLSVCVGPFGIMQIVITSDTTNCHINSIKEYINSLVLVTGVSNGIIAYDRYLHVALAHKYKIKMKGFVLNFLLLLPWLSIVAYLLSVIFGKLVNYGFLIIVTIALIATLSFNYTRLIRALNAQHNNINVARQSRVFREKRNYKAISLCTYLMIVEFTCSAPGLTTLICGFASVASGNTWVFWQDNNVIAKEASLMFFLLSACVNPIIYLYSHREFKQYLRKLFRRNKVGRALEDYTHGRNVREQPCAAIAKSMEETELDNM